MMYADSKTSSVKSMPSYDYMSDISVKAFEGMADSPITPEDFDKLQRTLKRHRECLELLGR